MRETGDNHGDQGNIGTSPSAAPSTTNNARSNERYTHHHHRPHNNIAHTAHTHGCKRWCDRKHYRERAEERRLPHGSGCWCVRTIPNNTHSQLHTPLSFIIARATHPKRNCLDSLTNHTHVSTSSINKSHAHAHTIASMRGRWGGTCSGAAVSTRPTSTRNASTDVATSTRTRRLKWKRIATHNFQLL